MADNFQANLTSPAPPATKRRTKTAAQRREQTKRSAARVAAAIVASVVPVVPSDPRLHATATSPPSTSSSAAALEAIETSPSPTCPPALAPLARDISCLLTSTTRSPWRGLRARKRRIHRPHRHERIARAAADAQRHQSIQLQHVQSEHAIFEQLRSACYDALGPLYAQLELQDPCSPGTTPLATTTPVPSYVPPPGRLLVHSRDDADECWAEIVHLAAIGAEAHEPDNPWAAREAVDAFFRLEDFWRDEFVAAHTALIPDADAFDAQQLGPFKLRYVLGLANWFLDPGN